MTGADDAVDPEELAAISKIHSFVEWGVLYSPADFGKPRFPTPEWVAHFLAVSGDTHKATHLCKDGLRQFSENDPGVMRHIDGFRRIQLNFGFEFDIAGIDLQTLARRVAARPHQRFILQYNDKTKHVLGSLNSLPNLEILFDASAGQGQSPARWPIPFANIPCGYAGGIGPDNIGQTLDQLSGVVPRGFKVWIDMEGRIRTDDRLDLKKVQTVLEIIALNTNPPTIYSPSKLELGIK